MSMFVKTKSSTKLSTKELIMFSLLGAIISLSQIALSSIPNVELVSLFTIIFAIVYGRKSIYSVAIFILITGLLYGFGTWWLGYVIIWPSLSLVTIALRKWLDGKYLILSIFSGGFGLIFGALYAIPYVFISGWNFALAYWIRGLPYDLIHMVGNYFTMIILGKIVYDLLIRINKNYLQ